MLQDDFDPPATVADMISEFLSRLIFIPSGNIEPETRAATWFVTSIGAVWIITILVTAIGLIYATPPSPAGPGAGRPAARAAGASTSRRRSSGC